MKVNLAAHRDPTTRVSLGGLDEINPDDIIYGEYSSGNKTYGSWIDLVYLDDDILRTFSGPVHEQHSVLRELKVLLRDEETFYLIAIKELLGLAFKHTDIVDIKVSSLIQGNSRHGPSCIWTLQFQGGKIRTLEADYQSYFAYGTTTRPKSETNASILDLVFSSSNSGEVN